MKTSKETNESINNLNPILTNYQQPAYWTNSEILDMEYFSSFNLLKINIGEINMSQLAENTTGNGPKDITCIAYPLLLSGQIQQMTNWQYFSYFSMKIDIGISSP